MAYQGHKFDFVVRGTHLITTFLLILSMLTGLRMAWLNSESPLFEPGSVIDTFTPAGQAHLWHINIGLALLFVGIVYVVYLFLGGQIFRYTALFTDKRRDYRKKMFYLWIMVFASVTILSGITLYTGMYEGNGGYGFIKATHHYGAIILLLLCLGHIIDVIATKGLRINSMFFARDWDWVLQRRFFLVACLVGLIAGLLISVILMKPATLVSRSLERRCVVDGNIGDGEWDGVDSVVVPAIGGANYSGGIAEVTLKSFHYRSNVYFLVRWNDPDRSYNRYLVKTDTGWVTQVSEYLDIFGESIYYEDMVALSFGNEDCASTCHMGGGERMGRHYTDAATLDVWQWRALGTNPVRQADDLWWGIYDDSVTGGRHEDNLAGGGYFLNLNADWQQPYFISTHSGMRYWIALDMDDAVMLRPDMDTFAVGSKVPSVLTAPMKGNRGDVRARGRWAGGVWTVEFSRTLKTGSRFDNYFDAETLLGVAVFNNAERKHAYHLRPVRLVVE